MKNLFALMSIFCVLLLCGCAGRKAPLPDHIDFENYDPAEVAMHTEEFRIMDSLGVIGRDFA